MSYVLNLGGGVMYGTFDAMKLNTGMRGGGASLGTVLCAAAIGCGNVGMLLTLNRFIADTTLKKILKYVHPNPLPRQP